ncbi:hypothetical protein [Roseateles amylovorans]|uniref:Uncharacterized protein n=1 Tax=Roseateles amylovorans TaxID=2978473 RepID=A0ABY6ATM8_9BURK|nr:hypothetical protein [Roseateles amylovorans]UXH76192.1 hypothetical protein N4261_14040 [Roseateles amylovorans]
MSKFQSRLSRLSRHFRPQSVRRPPHHRGDTARVILVVALVLPLVLMTSSCTPTAHQARAPLAYQVTIQIAVNDEKPQQQSATVLPGKATELRFNQLSTPLVVQVSASAAAWLHDVDLKASFVGRTPELSLEWAEAQNLGVPAELTATTGSPPVRYRFVMTADAAVPAPGESALSFLGSVRR